MTPDTFLDKEAAVSPSSQAARMDRMYARQRVFYDLTRKYYLFGRDRLIDWMELAPGGSALEVGCGTARNLIRLARRQPTARLYGLDASAQMLLTAQDKVRAQDLSGQIALRQGLAEELDHRAMFGSEEPFGVIYFSYSLSMIPTWRQAIDAALANLRPGGSLYFVDFWDQAELPALAQSALQKWLALFHVRHRPELLDYIRQIAADTGACLELHSVFRRYAWLGRLTPAAAAPNPAQGSEQI